MGHYHGHEGFLTFSKAKGVLIKQRFNAAKLIYPPYGKGDSETDSETVHSLTNVTAG